MLGTNGTLIRPQKLKSALAVDKICPLALVRMVHMQETMKFEVGAVSLVFEAYFRLHQKPDHLKNIQTGFVCHTAGCVGVAGDGSDTLESCCVPDVPQ